MQTSKPLRKLAADANVILSAVAGNAALRVFLMEGIEIAATEFNISEVGEYIGFIAEKYGLSEEILESQLRLLPLIIYQRNFCADFIDNASKRLAERDEDGIELLALALKLKVPIWSNDRHFQHSGVETYTTAKLLKILKVIGEKRRSPWDIYESIHTTGGSGHGKRVLTSKEMLRQQLEKKRKKWSL